VLTLREFVKKYNLSEELHNELKNTLNEPELDREGDPYQRAKLNQKKLNAFTKKTRALIKSGEDTGLEGDTPKKGSSRAVYFPKESKDVTIDGQKTKQPTAIKIAFAGQLDHYTGHPNLLGEEQNNVESDPFTQAHHSMLYRNTDGSYSTNENGVVAPVLDKPKDHNHWLEMARCPNLTKTKFKELTKTDTHPKGLNFDHFHKTLLDDYYANHGGAAGSGLSDSIKHNVRQHPLYEKMEDFVYNTANHPADMHIGNWGEWTHPVTGKKYPVVRDFGCSGDVAKLYSEARKNYLKCNYKF